MAHKIKVYPVGNGDTAQIVLMNGKRILLDFRHQVQGEDKSNSAIDLKKTLSEELRSANRNDFDIVAFTHADQDHIQGSTEFFELLHSKTYQGPGRIKIRELWVPAAMILEEAEQNQRDSEFVILRQEARYRLKEGFGIRVFSKPDKLKQWLVDNGLTVASRSHLISDAGTVVPSLNLANDGVEFFCHSPFIDQVDEEEAMRNGAALIFQVRFQVGSAQTNYFAIGDSEYAILEDIVRISKLHGNSDRLKWDLLNIPHHCSYKALGPEKGENETEPTKLIKEFLTAGQAGSYMICSSDPISADTKAFEAVQPPHIQAKKAYVRYLNQIQGRRFLVTMEEPNTKAPEPIVFEITEFGPRLLGQSKTGAATVVSSKPPKAG